MIEKLPHIFDVDEHVYVIYKMSIIKTRIVAIDFHRNDEKIVEYFIFGYWYEETDVFKTFDEANASLKEE